MNNERGFTILEIIIVIAIIAVLFGTGFLRLLDYRQRQTLNLTKQSIVAILRNAQDRSIGQESGVRWGVHFENLTGNNNDFYALFSGATYNSSNVVSKNNLDQEIQFSDPVDGFSKDVIFESITGKLDSAVSIIVVLTSDPLVFSTITIDTNGKISF